MITAIFSAIVGRPSLVTVIEKFIEFVTEQLDQAKKKRLAEEMDRATKLAKEKKDTSGMDKMFNPDKK